jgi:hypothetical protein
MGTLQLCHRFVQHSQRIRRDENGAEHATFVRFQIIPVDLRCGQSKNVILPVLGLGQCIAAVLLNR